MRAIEEIESDIAEIQRRIAPMMRDKQSLERDLSKHWKIKFQNSARLRLTMTIDSVLFLSLHR